MAPPAITAKLPGPVGVTEIGVFRLPGSRRLRGRMLRKNGVALQHLVDGFARFEKLDKGGMPYLSSHPPSAERIARMRARGGAPGAVDGDRQSRDSLV
jgi:hypothetical protein